MMVEAFEAEGWRDMQERLEPFWRRGTGRTGNLLGMNLEFVMGHEFHSLKLRK
jgi:hypothetical protein